MKHRLKELAVCLDIEDILGKFPSELSGGAEAAGRSGQGALVKPRDSAGG